MSADQGKFQALMAQAYETRTATLVAYLAMVNDPDRDPTPGEIALEQTVAQRLGIE
ncbi:hypothetical protein NQ036_03760 [Brevibacterium sp. 91QC2O2]|uniref:hypothetical protein n=1 Tax=Brevibacterium TaxID=1696 RepID=UPI00211B7F7B|nr:MULTISPECIES: hypothetical protein [unclassified Brevibacterium]MCQ9367363.1 hypothetical protein [Brevibacterium sp. 91QC2O2]MCQ9384624.1 hypothetical protein [Brevibacterium sp. 68QC2CO]